MPSSEIEWGEPEIPTKILDWETEKIMDRMERGLKKGIKQELHEDCSRIDKSTYFPTYKRIKEEKAILNAKERVVGIYTISEDTERTVEKEKKMKEKKKISGEGWKID